MKRSALLCLIFTVATLGTSFGQGALVWHFGDNGRLDFNTEPPTGTCNSAIDRNQEGTAGLTTSNGQDLFYTDGVTIWDRSDTPMPGANGNLLGGSSSATSALIVPDPGDSLRFYVFTVDAEDDIEGNGNNGISYTIVDLTLQGNGTVANPFGDVVSANTTLIGGVQTERLTAIPKADSSGFWIIPVNITGGQGTPILESYELTATGVNPAPTNTFNLNSVSIWWASRVGLIKGNTAGTQIAMTINGGVYLIDFNPALGSFTAVNKINTIPYTVPYGIEFSPDGRTLYASDLGSEAGTLYKYNLTSGSIASTESVVGTSTTNIGHIQAGPNGLLYVAMRNQTDVNAFNSYLGVIQDPDNFANPDFDPQGYQFGCGEVGFRGLPTFVPALVNIVVCLPPTEASLSGASDICDGESTVLTANLETGYQYYWINNTTGDTLSSGYEQNTFTADATGDYAVIITDALDPFNAGCSETSTAISVTEHSDPVISGGLNGNNPICRGSDAETFSLVTDPGYDSYSWNSNAGSLSNQNTSEVTVDMSLVNAPTNSVTISLVVEENHGSATCASAIEQWVVGIEDATTFEVTPNPIDVACESTGNTVTIQNTFEGGYSYATQNATTDIVVDAITSADVTFAVGQTSGSFEIVGTSGNGCATAAVPVTVNVLGCGLEADFSVDATACSDSLVTFDASNSEAGDGSQITAYNWTFPAEFTPTSSTADGNGVDSLTVTGTVSNSTGSPITLSAALVVENAIGMTDDTVNVSAITVNPTPEAISIDQSGLVCEGEDAIFKVTPYNANSSYAWSSTPAQNETGRGADSVVYENMDYNAPTDTSYVVSVTETNEFGCPGAEATTTLIIEDTPDPQVSVNNIQAVCQSTQADNSFTITNYNATSTYVISSSDPTIVVNRTDDQVAFDVDEVGGTITIQEISANGCQSGEVEVAVSVIGCSLTANFTVETSACESDTITFVSNSDPGGTTGFQIDHYRWTFPSEVTIISTDVDADGTDSATVVAVLDNPGDTPIIAQVTLEIENNFGLIDDTVRTSAFTINPLPNDFSIDTSGLICEGDTVDFEVTPVQTGVTYEWSSAGASVETSSDTTAFVVNGTTDYSVTVTASLVPECPISETVEIQIEETPVVAFNTDLLEIACESSDSTLTISPYNPSYTYDISNTGDATFTRTDDIINIDAGTESGVFTIQVTTDNGCVSAEATTDYDIFGCAVVAQFETSDESACEDDLITLTSTSFSVGGIEITDYTWTFDPADAVEVVGANDEDVIQIRMTNSDLTPDTVEVTLLVENAVGIQDDTVQAGSFIALPNPPVTDILASGGTCPGDTSSFIPSNYFEEVNYNWSHTNLEASVVPQIDDSLFQVVNGEMNDTITLTSNLYGCTNSVTTIRDITELPSNIQGIFGATNVCPIATSDSLYTYSITSENADVFAWTSDPANAAQIVGGQGTQEIQVVYTEFPLDVTLEVAVSNSACASGDTLELNIAVDTFYNPSPIISNPAICQDDSMTYYAEIEIEDYDGTLSETPTYTWYLNEDTLFDNIGDSLFMASVNDGDSITVTVDYSSTCIFHDAELTQSWTLNVIDRPGGVLAINGDAGDHYLTDIIELTNVELTDTLWETRFFTGVDQPITHDWYWLNTDLDSLVTDGISFPNWTIEPVTPFPGNSVSPPSANTPQYSVDYYLVTGNGVCYDTSIATLHIDFDIWIPNVFSPNNDGTFNTWVIHNLELHDNPEIEVYNRWGNLVYESKNQTYEPWDGTRDGQELPVGTYYYILKITEGDAQVSFTGDVSILR